MIPTPIGAAVMIVGLLLLFRPPLEMLAFVLGSALLAGASAVDLPVLGHSSLPPAILALGFLLLRLMRRDLRASEAVPFALGGNAWLILFCVYSAASAFVLPRIFAARIYVIPMQRATAMVPLAPSSQNITQAFYMLGTAAASVSASAVVLRRKAGSYLVTALIIITMVHVVTGLIDAVASAAHIQGVFAWARNGAYAQLDQEASGYHRIAGLTPEASAYSGIGAAFLVFMTELWLRDVRPLRTGLTALLMLLLLIASTSSTAYVVIVAYVILLAGRGILVPGSIRLSKGLAILALLAAMTLCCSLLLLLNPQIVSELGDILKQMTFAKSQSASGIERSLWARQGWDLFKQSRGLGVGVGSFRSSGLFTAVLGSVGPACLAILCIYCVLVLKPWRRSTFIKAQTLSENVGVAAAWAAVVQLVPASVSAPSSDPGLMFAALAGAALGLRSRRAFVGDNANEGPRLNVAETAPSAPPAAPRAIS